jgi:hypothetical protein
MKADLPVAGSYSFSVLAFGDDGRAEAVVPMNPTYRLADGEARPVTLLPLNRIGRIEASSPGVLELRFELDSAVPLTLNVKVYLNA